MYVYVYKDAHMHTHLILVSFTGEVEHSSWDEGVSEELSSSEVKGSLLLLLLILRVFNIVWV